MKYRRIFCAWLVLQCIAGIHASISDGIKSLVAPEWQRERVFIPTHERRLGEVVNETLGLHPLSGGGTTAYIVTMDAFWMDKYEVSIARFAEFASAVDAPTEAEAEKRSSVSMHRCIFGFSKETNLIHLLRHAADSAYQLNLTASKSLAQRSGAAWWAPAGKISAANRAACAEARKNCSNCGADCNSTTYSCSTVESLCPAAVESFGAMPVTHVTQREAELFCDWDGGFLPSEEQWEAAASGTLQGNRFPWGSSLVPNGTHHANLWQGMWPRRNAVRDGHRFVAPIDAYGPQNAWGLHNMIGNVAEHTSTPFCNATSLAVRSSPNSDTCTKILRHVGIMSDYIEKDSKDNMFARIPSDKAYKDTTVIKGGSYTSHATSDALFRIAGRSLVYENTTRDTLGFRCAYTTPHLRGVDGHEHVHVTEGRAELPPPPELFAASEGPPMRISVPASDLDEKEASEHEVEDGDSMSVKEVSARD